MTEHTWLKLRSGQTLRLSWDKIQCGKRVISLDRPDLFELLGNRMSRIRKLVEPPLSYCDIAGFSGHRIEIFPRANLYTKVQFGPVTLTYDECEQVYTTIDLLRQREFSSRQTRKHGCRPGTTKRASGPFPPEKNHD